MKKSAHIDLHRARVLDGGLATELERSGYPLRSPLWSAAAIEEAPERIVAVHRSYLDAGADILLTASYQVSPLGWPGLSEPGAAAAADRALRSAVALAVQARAEANRPEVLIAASLGPYGAALANGAEFHGNYGFASDEEQHAALLRFHGARIAVLADTDADLLAFETVPSLAEARAIVAALQGWPDLPACISFTCRDEQHLVHGERLRDAARYADAAPGAVAIGVNCTAPALIEPLLNELRAATEKPLIVYPNSGEGWDAEHRCWTGSSDVTEYAALAKRWYAAGAQIVGGCCRTTPAHVRAVREIIQR